MKKIVVVLIIAITISQLNCALIFSGAKSENERTSNIQMGYVVLDFVFTGFVGLFVDLATGAIYESKPANSKREIEQELRSQLSDKRPCYIIHNYEWYKAELIEGNLKETKISDNEVPPMLLKTIENEKMNLATTK